jgi:flagellin-specific chaperone FliS
MLYDIVYRILTNKNIVGYVGTVSGRDKTEYTNTRQKDVEIKKDYKIVESLFDKIVTKIPAFKKVFLDNEIINREEKGSSLLFKVIGQNIFFDVLKAALNENKLNAAIKLFMVHDFSLNNPIWSTVFWNTQKQSLITDAANQKYSKFLFLDKLEIPTRKTTKDLAIERNYGLKI